MKSLLDKIVIAICTTIVRDHQGLGALIDGRANKTQLFLQWQIRQMPDYLHAPFFALAICFNLQVLLIYFKPFHLLSHKTRSSILIVWRNSRWGFRRDFVRFFDTLVIYDLASAELEK